ncbi:hypothetical protein [Lactococcus cremoris]|nr:hypothetical protein [Lactococcus cremoris]
MSIAKTVEATSYAEIIQELESNAGWITDTDAAFKVAYIKEVVE